MISHWVTVSVMLFILKLLYDIALSNCFCNALILKLSSAISGPLYQMPQSLVHLEGFPGLRTRACVASVRASWSDRWLSMAYRSCALLHCRLRAGLMGTPSHITGIVPPSLDWPVVLTKDTRWKILRPDMKFVYNHTSEKVYFVLFSVTCNQITIYDNKMIFMIYDFNQRPQPMILIITKYVTHIYI